MEYRLDKICKFTQLEVTKLFFEKYSKIFILKWYIYQYSLRVDPNRYGCTQTLNLVCLLVCLLRVCTHFLTHSSRLHYWNCSSMPPRSWALRPPLLVDLCLEAAVTKRGSVVSPPKDHPCSAGLAHVLPAFCWAVADSLRSWRFRGKVPAVYREPCVKIVCRVHTLNK